MSVSHPLNRRHRACQSNQLKLPRVGRLFTCTLLFIFSSVAAAQTHVRQLVFEPPREANFRQQNGSLGRGHLVSINSQNVRIRLGNGTDKTVPLDSIKFLRTIDQTFSYSSTDDISEVISQGAQLEDTMLETIVIDASGTASPSVNGGFGTAVDNPSGSENMQNNGGFGTAKPVQNGGFGAAKPSTDTPEGMVVICDNCKKEVSVNAKYGQECPHCGIEWSLDNPATAAAGPSSANHGNRRDGQFAVNRTPAKNPLNATTAPQAAPPASNVPPASSPQSSGELSVAEIPVWMKAGLFFLFAGAGYYMFFYRA